MSKIDWRRIKRNGAVLGGKDPVNKEIIIPRMMPFGKYKDLPISELPTEYVHWLLNELKKKPTIDSGLYLALAERITSEERHT